MTDRLREFLAEFPVLGTDRFHEIGAFPFLFLLVVSVLSAMFIAFLYLRFYAGRSSGSGVYRAFPLLGLSVTAIFICIQFSLPLSLGLLGALSIVRFRTPIKEPEEIGFIMLLIAASLACATFNLFFLVIILGVALAALVARRYAPASLSGPTNDGSLILSMSEEQYNERSNELMSLLDDRLRKVRVESVSKNGSEIVVTLSFKSMRARSLLGIESDLRKLVRPLTFTILYTRPGTI